MKTEEKKRGSFFGVLLIVLGVVLFLNIFGFFEVFVFEAYRMFWPVGLIIAGAFFVMRWKGAGHLFLALTIILGIMYLFSGHGWSDGEEHLYLQTVPLDEGVVYGEINLDYGAGELSFGVGNELFENNIVTSDVEEPSMDVSPLGDKVIIDVSREAHTIPWHGVADKWDISLSSSVIYDLNIDFGAAELDMDLRELQMRSVTLDTGASDSRIIFGSYPTVVDIDTGASSVEFEFPSDMHVIVDYDGGASSVDLHDFYKRDGVYYSDGFDVDAENVIRVDINAGASSITGSWYAVVAEVVSEEPVVDEAIPIESGQIQLEIVTVNDTNVSVEE